MNLRRRQKRKTKQALDAAASVTKLWSELKLGKRAAKGVEKAKELRPPSKVKRVLSFKWVKIGGAVAVAGGAAAAVTRKLKGSDPADYSGPPPSAAADVAVPSPENPPPLSVAPDPATQERDTEPASGPTALRANRDAAAAAAAASTATPEAASDAAEAAPEPAADAADDAPEPAPDAADDAPEPAAGAQADAADDEELASGTTVDAAPDEDPEGGAAAAKKADDD